MKKLITYLALSILIIACSNSDNSKKQDSVVSTENNKDAPINTGTPSKNVAEITMLVNGVEWQGSGFFNSHLYYAKGLEGVDNGRPNLSISFRAIALPDDRQLTLAFNGFDGKPGSYTKDNLSAGFTGSANGSDSNIEMLSNKSFDNYSDLAVNVTNYTVVNNDEAIIDGTVSGSFTKKGWKIENGKFSGVKVKVFNEKY